MIAKNETFAIKGGTAINFFIRDIPRFSADIDLTYIEITESHQALDEISSFLFELKNNIHRTFTEANVHEQKLEGTIHTRSLIININNATVKIEPNLIIQCKVNTVTLHKVKSNLPPYYYSGGNNHATNT